MKPGSAPDQAQESVPETLGQRLLAEWARASGSHLPDAPSLVVFNPAAPSPGLESMVRSRGAPALRLAMGSDRKLQWADVSVARTGSRALPLQTATFGAVLLCHVVGRGDEPELAEACRLLQPGGRLFVLGLNRMGFRYLSLRSSRELPGIRPLAVRARLEALEMNVLGLWGAGFLRTERPHRMNHGPARILVPIADMFMILAGPVEPKIMKPLAKSKLRAVGAPSALAGR